MFESIINFLKKFGKQDKTNSHSKDAAKERLHLVLMQDRANVSADFLDLMKQEIIEVIKKYIDVDENEIDVRLANKTNEDGTTGAPALYANIPIISIKDEAKKEAQKENKKEEKSEENKETKNAEKEDKQDDNKIEDIKHEEEFGKWQENKQEQSNEKNKQKVESKNNEGNNKNNIGAEEEEKEQEEQENKKEDNS